MIYAFCQDNENTIAFIYCQQYNAPLFTPLYNLLYHSKIDILL